MPISTEDQFADEFWPLRAPCVPGVVMAVDFGKVSAPLAGTLSVVPSYRSLGIFCRFHIIVLPESYSNYVGISL